MKLNSIRIAIFACITLFLLDSCTVTKRRYNKGFHVDWFGSGATAKKTEEKNNQDFIEPMEAEQPVLASAEPKMSMPLVQEKLENTSITSDRLMVETADNQMVEEEVSPVIFKHKILNKMDVVKKRNPKKKQEIAEANSSKPLGIILLIIGFLVMLFVSLLLGVILMVIGIVILISGGSKKDKSESEGTYVDVVYLKNGSIIRGIIIEQIPNEQLKIKTKDGSVFVYKMDEVEKITKELESGG